MDSYMHINRDTIQISITELEIELNRICGAEPINDVIVQGEIS